jgi:hypothetical protein
MDDMRVEEKVASTIFQEKEKIKIGTKEYDIAPPTTATLIQVSRLISKLPEVKLESDEVFFGSLMIAKDCQILGHIAAILILGVDRNTFYHSEEKRLLNRLKSRHAKKVKALSDTLLCECTPKELNSIIVQQLSRMEIGDFFALTTSLCEINILRKTRGVVPTTTASGR